MSQTRLNDSNRAELLAAYADGVPVKELAARFGVHRGTISRIVQRVDLPHHSLALPLHIRQEAARLYAEGLTLTQVADQLGISIKGARNGITACGGTMRPCGRQPHDESTGRDAHGIP